MKKIIEENKLRIQYIIRKLTGSNSEDIEQEVYIKTWKNLDNYKENNKFKSWISILTANVCKDYLKSKAHKIETLKSSDEEALENIKDKNDPQNKLNSKMRQKVILKAVNSLSKNMREVVILFEFEEKSYEEIAKKLNIPKGTVKSRLFSARKVLAEKLSELI